MLSLRRAYRTRAHAQGAALDELTEDVDQTQGRMATATAVMKKLAKSKDNGKLCAILVLSIILIALVFMTFG